VRFTPIRQRWRIAWKSGQAKNCVHVLDRPNPLGGEVVEGPVVDADKTSFTAYFAMPVRYGLTIGELANYSM